MEEGFAKSLARALEGADPALLDKMVDPKRGLAGKSVFPPSIAECLEWMEKEENFYARQRERLTNERDTLKSREDWTQDPQEVRETVWEAWERKKVDFVKRGDELERAKDKPLDVSWRRPEIPKETMDKLRMQALENNRATRNFGEEPEDGQGT